MFFCSVFFLSCLRDVVKFKKFQTSKINLEVGGWVFDDYLFLGIKYCQNTVSKLHFTRLPPLPVLSFLSMSEIG